ncbi:MAG: methylmalonyl-CoA epimerase [Dehalococcoidia bacterium]|nr:methylmalonyl-CoA epimerase [Dehalococcoidia bacterium]
MKVDHVGIAVRNIEDAVKAYTWTFGGRLVHREELAKERVTVAFLDAGGILLELLAPTAEGGSLGRFLELRGVGLHHLAFEVADIQRALRNAERAGHLPVDRHPRRGSRGRLIAFLHPSSAGGVLIELVEAPA